LDSIFFETDEAGRRSGEGYVQFETLKEMEEALKFHRKVFLRSSTAFSSFTTSMLFFLLFFLEI